VGTSTQDGISHCCIIVTLLPNYTRPATHDLNSYAIKILHCISYNNIIITYYNFIHCINVANNSHDYGVKVQLVARFKLLNKQYLYAIGYYVGEKIFLFRYVFRWIKHFGTKLILSTVMYNVFNVLFCHDSPKRLFTLDVTNG